MRLLPQSAKASWLIALTAWFVASVGLWWALPIRPRVLGRFPENWREFSADGSSFVAYDTSDHTGRVVELRSGTVREVPPADGPYSLEAVSADGRWAAYIDPAAPDLRVRVVGLKSCETFEWNGFGKAELTYAWINRNGTTLTFSATREGRRGLAIVSVPPAGSPVFIEVNGLERELQDGRYIMDTRESGVLGDGTATVVIYSAADGREVWRHTFARRPPFVTGVVPGERGAIVNDYFGDPRTVARIDADGKTAWSVRADRLLGWQPDGRHVVLDEEDEAGRRLIVVRDAEDGSVQRRFVLPTHAYRQQSVSPDLRTMYATREGRSPPEVVRDVASYLGLDWLLPSGDEAWLVDLATAAESPVLGCRLKTVHFSADGTRLYAVSADDRLLEWDVPPRRPLAWFAAGTATLALAIGLGVRRHLRRMARQTSGRVAGTAGSTSATSGSEPSASSS